MTESSCFGHFCLLLNVKNVEHKLYLSMKMTKKFGVLMALILAIAGTANAKIIDFGIKAGMNVNKISFNKKNLGLTDPGNSFGWEAGVMAEVNVPIVGLCFDAAAMYARMNNAANVSNIDNKEFGKNFIMIPVNIKYKFTLPVVSRFLSPYIFTGPEFAFKLDKNTVNSFKTHTCQVAWNVGLGLQLINHLQIGASYGFGINNIADKYLNTTDIKAKNNYWTVTAAYLF